MPRVVKIHAIENQAKHILLQRCYLFVDTYIYNFVWIIPHICFEFSKKSHLFQWHDFFVSSINYFAMIDLILSMLIVIGAYLGSACFAIVLFRIFFPLKSKPIENKLTFSYTGNNTIHSSSKNKVHLLSVSGRKDWVKMNS